MRDHYAQLLDQLLEAQVALVKGGVKSYTIDDRTLTRFDLKTLADEIEWCEEKLDECEALLTGGAKRKAVAIIPRDS